MEDYKKRIREFHKNLYLFTGSTRMVNMLRFQIEKDFPEAFKGKDVK